MSAATLDYTGRGEESSEEETRAGKELSHGRWLGKKMAKAAIAEYDRTWKDHCWHEVITRQSQRRFANALAEAQTAPSLP
ncbi:MAG: hypothetical protein ACJ74Z_16135 [Bryobacteraceae bacterium]|jgi:hypothetical protein